jgi:hypothetical protein
MVKDFVLERDYNTIARWYESHNQPVPAQDVLPTFGLIDDKAAAGFLIVCDCNLGILEFYITDPESTKSRRDHALDEITTELLKYGRAIGIRNFKCDTEVDAIAKRAEKFGFRHVGSFMNLYLRMD